MAKAKRKVSRRRSVYRSIRRRASGIRIPIAAVAGFLPLGGMMIDVARNPDVYGAKNALTAMGVQASRSLAGIDPRNGQFNAAWLGTGLFPIIAGLLVHKFVGGKLGVNKMLAASGIPLIRL